MNFDIKQMLAEYDNDAEKLANDFAAQLNAELAKRKQNDILHDLSAEVGCVWNDLVEEYYSQGKMDRDADHSDYYFDDDTALILLQIIIKCMPAIQTWSKSVNKLAKDVTAPANNVFEQTMSNFFNKMGW